VKHPDRHLSRIQRQFRRQAAAYERLTGADERGFQALVALSRVDGAARALDVACGPGFLTMALAGRCRQAVGVDGTDVFLDHARGEAARRGIGNIAFTLGNVEQLPFPAAVFDVVVCRAAFHHFPRVDRVLAEMIRTATPQGRLVVADLLTAKDPAKARYHNRIERLCDPTHVRALPESEFEQLFAAHGLAVAFKGQQRIDYALPDWIAHGGPPPARAAKIVALMRDSIAADCSGLAVREQDGELHFSHTGVAFLLEKRS
jgi:ubiquinone/menaquinone biosynthesis C-methylase UbiE